MKKIISPVGTSIFTNYMKKEVIDAYKNYRSIDTYYKKIVNITAVEYDSGQYKSYIKDIYNIIKDKWLKGITKIDSGEWKREENIKNSAASAEIKSLLKIKDVFRENIDVHIIATDTVLSRLAAEMIKEYFIDDPSIRIFFEVQKDVIKDLQITDSKKFEKQGLINLIDRFDQITGGYYENTILNITGGYKAVIPYLTIMAQVYNIPCYYIFEDTDELIQIPSAPIDINWGLFSKYKHILSELKEVVEGKSWDQFRREKNIEDDFQSIIWIDKCNGDCLIGLNAIGLLFWNKYQTFFTVKIPKGSKYETENVDKKENVTKAIKELYRRLKLINNFETLEDTDIKHTPIEDTWVFKSGGHIQLRIQYKVNFDNPKEPKITFYNYRFISNHSEDKSYKTTLKREYENLKSQELIVITLKKPEE